MGKKQLCKISGNIAFSSREKKFLSSIRSTTYDIEKVTEKTIFLVENCSRTRKSDLNKVEVNSVLVTDILNRVNVICICYKEDEYLYIEKVKEFIQSKFKSNMEEVQKRLEASKLPLELNLKLVDY